MSNVNIPDYCSSILKKIYEKLNRCQVPLAERTLTFTVSLVLHGEEYTYSHEGIVAIQRCFKPYGWDCKMTYYRRRESVKNDEILYGYIFTFHKIDKTSDLPF